jgi:hypothetical protein
MRYTAGSDCATAHIAASDCFGSPFWFWPEGRTLAKMPIRPAHFDRRFFDQRLHNPESKETRDQEK